MVAARLQTPGFLSQAAPGRTRVAPGPRRGVLTPRYTARGRECESATRALKARARVRVAVAFLRPLVPVERVGLGPRRGAREAVTPTCDARALGTSQFACAESALKVSWQIVHQPRLSPPPHSRLASMRITSASPRMPSSDRPDRVRTRALAPYSFPGRRAWSHGPKPVSPYRGYSRMYHRRELSSAG